MKKTLALILMLALLITIVPAHIFPSEVDASTLTNLMTGTIGTFEDGTVNGWTAFNAGAVTASTTVAHSGSYAIKFPTRTSTWYSPTYNIYSIIKSGGAGTYNISFWVYVDALTTNPGVGSMLIRSDSPGQYSFLQSGQSFGYLSGVVSTSSSTWTYYSGAVTVTAADISNATGNFSLMIDSLGTATTQNLYIDDVVINPPYSTPISNIMTGTTGTFEDGTENGWTAFNNGTVSASTTVAHSGSYSIKFPNRTSTWYSPSYNIYSLIKAQGAGAYNISFWVYVDALTTNPGVGSMLIRSDSPGQYSFLESGQSFGCISGAISTPVSTWTYYSGTVTVTAADISGATGNFSLMIDSLGATATQNLYIDDVKVNRPYTSVATNIVTGTTGTFEDGTENGWTAFNNGTVSTSTTVAHSGSYSIKFPNRTSTWYSPSYNIYSLIKAQGAGTYNISFWVYVDALTTNPGVGSMLIRSDSPGQYSFLESGQSFGCISGAISTSVSTWTYYSGAVTVTAADISGATGNFSLMIDSLGATATQNLYIDDLQINPPYTIERWCSQEISFTSDHPTPSCITGTTGTFEDGTVNGWSTFGGGTLSASTTVKKSESYSVKLDNRMNSWDSPAYNIYSLIKSKGEGTYNISFWVYVDSLTSSPGTGKVAIRADSAGQYSFLASGQSYGYCSANVGISTPVNTWTNYTGSLTVTAADISGATGNFSLMIDSLAGDTNQNLYMDDVQVTKEAYTDAFNDVTLDVTFTGPNSTTIVMPAFWDGGSTWKVRFAPTLTGTWNYTTTCSNTSDTGLHNKIGVINCTAYAGSLVLYQKGLVKAVSGNRYFTYADGMPFFYIGDTHWSMPTEPYASMFQPLVDKRVSQGFTVYQSEPIGATYELSDGLNSNDLAGFADMDNRFKYIADAGLVHSNSQLFFTNELSINATKYTTAYLQKLSRYWVARYASYPVMWATAQECDDDFYALFNAATNPWKTVFNAVHTYDPYLSPQTAHQEAGLTTTSSVFKSLTGYNCYATQWSACKNAVQDFTYPKDYWDNGGTKPAMQYESCYENLMTNDFGARMQGWTSYLNGMYAHGYGAQDIWYYNTTYGEDGDATYDGITITVAMKQVSWTTSQDFAAATALGTYMKNFFSAINWWQLTPRFNSTSYFVNNSSYYTIASNSNTQYVCYFYNTTTNTGTLKGLQNVKYTKQWYNPRTGVYSTAITVTVTGASHTIGAKPDGNDWVLCFTKQ